MRKTQIVSVLLAVFFAGATLAAAPGRNETGGQMIWMVQVSIPERPDFSVAVQETGREGKSFGVIPLKDAGIPAIAVTAQEGKHGFLVNLYAAKNFKPGMKCQELRAMMVDPVETLMAAKGQFITTTSFVGYGVPSIGLLAYQKQGPAGKIRPIGCCGCGTLTCCPNAGQCIDCSICGMCCKD